MNSENMSIGLTLNRVGFAVEEVSGWGQRVEPAPTHYVGYQNGLWHVQEAQIPFERMGIYLGDGKVLVITALP